MKLLSSMLFVLLILVGCSTTPTVDEAVINVYTRDATSGTREAFESGIGLEKAELTKDAIEVEGNGPMAFKVGADEKGIGYVSLTTDFEANNLKPLTFKGVEATIKNVLNKSYTLSRPFSFTTRASKDFENDTIEKVVAAFIDFLINSTEGLEAVEGAGGIVDLEKGKAWSELKTNHPVLSEDLSAVSLKTGGSTSVEKTLKAALEAFQADTGVQFVMNHTGSGDGYKRTLGEEKDSANAAHIGFASREFKSEEDVAPAMVSGEYALDAVVVVVNKANTTITNLTAKQLVSIFRGETTKFSDIK